MNVDRCFRKEFSFEKKKKKIDTRNLDKANSL